MKAMVGEIRGMRNEIADGRVFYQGVVNCRRAEREAAREAAKQEEKEKLKQEEERRQLIMRLARECGVNESSPTWIGVLKLMKDETGISFFFASDNVGKRTTIEYYARADVAASTVADDSDDEEEYGEADDSDDEFDRLLLANLMQEEAAAAAAMYGAWCCCREVLFGGLRVCKPSRLPCAVQGDQVPSSRVSKRRRTTR